VYAFGLLIIDLFSPDSTILKREPTYVKMLPKEAFPFLSVPLREIVHCCLERSPSGRPTFSRIVDLLEDYYYTNWKPDDSEKDLQVIEDMQQRMKNRDEEIKKKR